MLCAQCKVLKLRDEFPREPLNELCRQHPSHRCLRCLREALNEKPICPECGTPIEPRILETLETEFALLSSWTPGNGAASHDDAENVFRVVTLDGRALTLPLDPNLLVISLKDRVHQEMPDTPPARQQFFYSGAEIPELLDRRAATLGDFGVVAGSDIFMVVSVYTEHAGQNHIDGALLDSSGNAKGSQYDLAADSTFKGELVVVLQEYNNEGDVFSVPAQECVRKKGFDLLIWKALPSLAEFQQALDRACQFWLISTSGPVLTPPYFQLLQQFFEKGRGLYIWGDNQPFYVDANALGSTLFGASMAGNVQGSQVVHQRGSGNAGFNQHLITTGLEHLFEGITVATVTDPRGVLQPILYGSAGNLITAVYDREGRRAIFDGAFTRLYCNWDDAGTARYVVNCAVWLFNHERNLMQVRERSLAQAQALALRGKGKWR
ncbi:hypothetical protein PAPYR_3187 [Paratrimastix pyriformis]|uniref:Ubiquitin-like domain-containing protein n=1 Tax=Paratrimastix pyriformis TaxID=342808 RepID=A0ABQ8UMZ7_9EUKA|nr:hypothetical protein PAPYR_3187 [Paratrimastix pyriformis]|eukprot:GAFH01002017.1.p1 GENE.GAFH01002017.1~~GAFH01002017.1.p1  ORF type:complete len:436 (+),score=-4.00 GAFH01002017.1:2-1309(+)